MSQTKQITTYALHTFLEQIEEAIFAGFKIHKTPATYAKLIGGRYTVTMVKPAEIVVDVAIPDNVTQESDVVKDDPSAYLSGLDHPLKQGGGVVGSLTIVEMPPHTNDLPAKPTTRGRKKAGDNDES